MFRFLAKFSGVVVVVVVVVLWCCRVLSAQPLKTKPWESGPALRGPTLGLALLFLVVVVVANLDFPGPPSAGG